MKSKVISWIAGILAGAGIAVGILAATGRLSEPIAQTTTPETTTTMMPPTTGTLSDCERVAEKDLLAAFSRPSSTEAAAEGRFELGDHHFEDSMRVCGERWPYLMMGGLIRSSLTCENLIELAEWAVEGDSIVFLFEAAVAEICF